MLPFVTFETQQEKYYHRKYLKGKTWFTEYRKKWAIWKSGF